jgi:hypothetical protein
VMKTRQADIDLARAAWLKQQTQVWAAQKAEHDKAVAAKIKLATEAIHHEAQAWVTAFELEKKQITQARDAADAKSREALEEEYERFIISLESGHGGAEAAAAAVVSPGAALPAVIGQSQSQSQGAPASLPATIGAAQSQSQSSAGSLPGVIGQSPQQQPQVASMPGVIGAAQPQLQSAAGSLPSVIGQSPQQPQVPASLPGVIGASQSQQAASHLPSVIGQ